MLHSIKGKVRNKGDHFLVIDTGSFSFKIFSSEGTLKKAVKEKGEVELFCYLYFRENFFELYGFLEERSMRLFEMLNSVSGIGPKTALGVLDVDSTENITAAIIEKRLELLTRASGIGKKTAERVILELHNKLTLPHAHKVTERMDLDADIEEALTNLGYSRREAKSAISKLGDKPKKMEERLKEALKLLS